jgi:hypothetical protein
LAGLSPVAALVPAGESANGMTSAETDQAVRQEAMRREEYFMVVWLSESALLNVADALTESVPGSRFAKP